MAQERGRDQRNAALNLLRIARRIDHHDPEGQQTQDAQADAQHIDHRTLAVQHGAAIDQQRHDRQHHQQASQRPVHLWISIGKLYRDCLHTENRIDDQQFSHQIGKAGICVELADDFAIGNKYTRSCNHQQRCRKLGHQIQIGKISRIDRTVLIDDLHIDFNFGGKLARHQRILETALSGLTGKRSLLGKKLVDLDLLLVDLGLLLIKVCLLLALIDIALQLGLLAFKAANLLINLFLQRSSRVIFKRRNRHKHETCRHDEQKGTNDSRCLGHFPALLSFGFASRSRISSARISEQITIMMNSTTEAALETLKLFGVSKPC